MLTVRQLRDLLQEGPPAAMLEVLAVDDTLAALESALKSQDLYERTNIVVAAEHGSSTVWKDSATSVSREFVHKNLRRNTLPPGFLAIDIVDALQKVDGGLSLFDPDNANKLVAYTSGEFPARGNAVIAVDPTDPFATIEARGGYDLIYLPASLPIEEARRRAQLIANDFFSQDYFGGLFVDEAKVARMGGALCHRAPWVGRHIREKAHDAGQLRIRQHRLRPADALHFGDCGHATDRGGADPERSQPFGPGRLGEQGLPSVEHR